MTLFRHVVLECNPILFILEGQIAIYILADAFIHQFFFLFFTTEPSNKTRLSMKLYFLQFIYKDYFGIMFSFFNEIWIKTCIFLYLFIYSKNFELIKLYKAITIKFDWRYIWVLKTKVFTLKTNTQENSTERKNQIS